ncbi:Uncharacterised protein [Streptococcus pneumoniae]|nr:Uncharacterised protein [Streptococcus pneumoniae]
MDNIIDVSIPVAEVVDKHPEVLEILVEGYEVIGLD